MRKLLFFAVGSIFLAGCYPTLPPVLGEGTEVLRPGGVSLTAAGAGAAFGANVTQCCAAASATEVGGGLEARLRAGIGAKQEIGASVFLGIGNPYGNGDPPFAAGGAISYKVAPLQWLAVVADAGALDFAAASVGIVSGDLAVIAAPYTAANGTQLYTAVKGAIAVPFLSGSRDLIESVTVPIGLSVPTSKRVRFLVEAGPIFGFAQQVDDSAPDMPLDATSIGAYAAVAFTFVLR